MVGEGAGHGAGLLSLGLIVPSRRLGLAPCDVALLSGPLGGGDGGMGLALPLRKFLNTCQSASSLSSSGWTSSGLGQVSTGARSAFFGGKHPPALAKRFLSCAQLELGMLPGGQALVRQVEPGAPFCFPEGPLLLGQPTTLVL